MIRTCLSCLVAITVLSVQGQNLPKWLTEAERALIPSYLEQRSLIRGNGPPPWTPRAMAEWEELDGLLITWAGYYSILAQIVDHAQEETTVYLVAQDSQQAKNTLAGYGVPLKNLRFLKAPFNSIWCRDYGPWTIYRNDVQERAFADWIYNRPRPDDDVIPQALAALLGIATYDAVAAPDDLVHTGGNFMVDGHGTAFSSKLILDENGPQSNWNVTVKTKDQIDTIMRRYLGIHRYVLMDNLPYDAIHHIDMHMKLLDEETLLVGEFPSGISDGPYIEANVQYVLDNYLSCYGRPYRVIRVPMVPSESGKFPPNAYYRTYTNAVFVNRTLLVPTYREEYDTTALRILREALPGYNVVGIDCDNNNAPIIAGNGAIHCITKEIGHSDPIWIAHAPVRSATAGVPILIEAKMRTPSGIEWAAVHWTSDTSNTYLSLPLAPAGNDTFYAYLPALPEGTPVFYYLTASSYSGRTVSKPLTAPDGYWHFVVEPGTVAAPEPPAVSFFEVFPNPAHRALQVGITCGRPMSGALLLYDPAGRLQLRQELELKAGNQVVPLVLNLVPGSYLLVLQTADSRQQKVVLLQ